MGSSDLALYAALATIFTVLTIFVTREVVAGTCALIVTIGLLLVSVTSATAMADERAGGNLDVLLATPLSTRAIVLAKWWSAFRVVPGIAVFAAALAFDVGMNSRRWIIAVAFSALMTAVVLAFGALVTSVGIALAAWQSRLSRAVGLSVSAYLAATVIYPAAIMFVVPPRAPDNMLYWVSPFAGIYIPLSMTAYSVNFSSGLWDHAFRLGGDRRTDCLRDPARYTRLVRPAAGADAGYRGDERPPAASAGGGSRHRMRDQSRMTGLSSWLLRAIANGSRGLAAVRRRGTGLRYALAGAGATVLAIVAWHFFANWRLGRIELQAEGEPVIVQVLDEFSDTPVGEPFDLASRVILSLPAGEYRLRVDGEGRLGRTYRFGVNRGETQTHTISLDEGRLLRGEPAPAPAPMRLGNFVRDGEPEPALHKPMPFAPVTAALELTPGTASLIERTDQALVCRNGATGKIRWEVKVSDEGPRFIRDQIRFLRAVSFPRSDDCRFVNAAPDLDGDGTGDLLFCSGADAKIIAYSGKDGSTLWSSVGVTTGSGGPRIVEPVFGPVTYLARWNSTAGEPAMADIDRDGTVDLIATVIAPTSTFDQHTRTVVAISGRSGRLLWSYPIDKAPTKLSRGGRNQPAALVHLGKSTIVAVVDQTNWVGLDPATGTCSIGPIDLGAEPVVPVQYADLDGDGEREILMVELGPGVGLRTLRAFSIESRSEWWSVTTDAAFDSADPREFLRDQPAIVDLDRDGRPEIIVPASGIMPPLVHFRGVMLIDGATGATRWHVPMRPSSTKSGDNLAQVTVAPDLDGDGVREVVTVTSLEQDKAREFYVDALSGKDGRRLWWWKVDRHRKPAEVGKPTWWGHGPDGWPLLSLPLCAAEPDWVANLVEFAPSAEPVVHLLEASTGRERHTVLGLKDASFADLDGDGLTDLWGDAGGELRTFRGEAPEAWRATWTIRPRWLADGSGFPNAEAHAPGRDAEGGRSNRAGHRTCDHRLRWRWGGGRADRRPKGHGGASPRRTHSEPPRAGSVGAGRARDLEDGDRRPRELVQPEQRAHL